MAAVPSDDPFPPDAVPSPDDPFPPEALPSPGGPFPRDALPAPRDPLPPEGPLSLEAGPRLLRTGEESGPPWLDDPAGLRVTVSPLADAESAPAALSVAPLLSVFLLAEFPAFPGPVPS